MPVQIDMEMPRSCGDCRFCRTEVFGCVYCDAYGNYSKEISPCTKLQLFAGRKDWCPLMEAKEQKWHVVADGDLPPKRPKRGFLHLYIVTYNYEDDPMITPCTGLAWYDCKGEWIGYNEEIDDFESGDVLAWRELPEPWEERMK